MGNNDLAPGAVLMGRYVIEGELGAGGFGQVFRARQEPLGRAVAIKVLHASANALAQGTRDRFFREAHLAQRLEHPNTVRVLDIGTTGGGLPFIVLELLRGTTLGDYLLRFGPMPDAQVHRVTTQILKSLMEAHAFGVVHRDIKPANIFITSHPGEPLFVKVLDFGIAKDLFASPESAPKVVARTVAIQPNITPGASGNLTSQSQALGTPRYMSPEQIVGDTIGPWTDVYAVGLVMAEMLTASPVFEGESAVEILLERATGSPTPLKLEVTRSRLYHTIARATATSPHERFQSAEQMLLSMGAEEQVSGSIPIPISVQSTAAAAVAVTAPAAGPTALLTAPMQRGPAHVPPPPKASAPRSNGLVKLAIGGGTLVAAGIVVGAIALSQRAKGAPKEKTPHSATALASTSTSPAPPAPAPAPSSEKTAAKPALPISKRTVPVLLAADVERRVLLAGFTLQSPPKEESSGLGRTINAPVIRGECFGSVQYFDYKNPKDAEVIQQSTSSMAGKPPPTLRTGGRMISVAIVARAGKETCENDLLDALTR